MAWVGALFNSYSGMQAMSGALDVTANNVANLNTTAYKSSVASFSDVMSGSILQYSTAAGDGAAVDAISTSFTQGSTEGTSQSTDMAISGNGFFIFRGGEDATAVHYSRDGNFGLIEGSDDGYNLVSSMGSYVQGYNLNAFAGNTGETEDIVIENVADPSATTAVNLIVNLQSDMTTAEESDSYLFENWDGTNVVDGEPVPIDSDDYFYSSTVSLFDTEGNSQELNVYFDYTSEDNIIEFLVTCDPSLDQRIYDQATGSSYNSSGTTENSGAGALLYGQLTFDTNGALVDMSCWDVPADGEVLDDADSNLLELGRGDEFYSFSYNFTGTETNSSATLDLGTSPTAQSVTSTSKVFADNPAYGDEYITGETTWAEVYDENGYQLEEGDVITFTGTDGDGVSVTYSYTVALDDTVQSLMTALESQFSCTASLSESGELILTDTEIGDSQLAITSVAYTDSSGNGPDVITDLAQVFGPEGEAFDTTGHERFTIESLSTTSYASTSSTIYSSQDGYGVGYLEDIHVDSSGVIYGYYSNGQEIAQAQVALAQFTSLAGLAVEGGNLYLPTSDAGETTIGTPGEDGFGSITGNALELSNVDISKEFVDLITIQRAFQANAKAMTTVDEMMDVTLGLK